MNEKLINAIATLLQQREPGCGRKWALGAAERILAHHPQSPLVLQARKLVA